MRTSTGGRRPPTELYLAWRSAQGTGNRGGPLGERVTRFILWMPVMTAYPLPVDMVEGGKPIQLVPEILVLLSLPPQRHGLDKKLGIGMEHDPPGSRQRPQCLDGRRHFHAVVRGLDGMSRSFGPLLADCNNVGPAAWTWIAETTAIGPDGDFVDHGRVGTSTIGKEGGQAPMAPALAGYTKAVRTLQLKGGMTG